MASFHNIKKASPELARFMKLEEQGLQNYTSIALNTAFFGHYVKLTCLVDERGRITLRESLRNLLKPETEQITYPDLQKLLRPHIERERVEPMSISEDVQAAYQDYFNWLRREQDRFKAGDNGPEADVRWRRKFGAFPE